MPEARPQHREVVIPAGAVSLPGSLAPPSPGSGIVLFAHGRGSSRHSPRNRLVASALHRAGLGTLLFDLLTEHEAEQRSNVFDIEGLAERLLAAAHWIIAGSDTLPIGLFGASTGAAAALAAAARQPLVRAVVSRGGRPDLAGAHLAGVRAPTLLIVGEEDKDVLALNRAAFAQLGCERRLAVVPAATHLFDEPGTLEEVARLATEWFTRFLGGAA